MSRLASGHDALSMARISVLNAKTASELRAAQAVLLPLEVGLTMEMTAIAVGRSRSWVAKARHKFIALNGYKPDKKQGIRGGRHREIVPEVDECRYVMHACARRAYTLYLWNLGSVHAAESHRPLAKYLQEDLEDMRGEPVALSTAYKMIERTARKEFLGGAVKDWNMIVFILFDTFRT